MVPSSFAGTLPLTSRVVGMVLNHLPPVLAIEFVFTSVRMIYIDSSICLIVVYMYLLRRISLTAVASC